MKKGLKIVLKVILALVGVILVLAFLAFSAKSEIVPDIYVTSESGKVALAVRGGYTWNSFSESVVADSIAPEDYVYQNNNVLLVTPGETMTFQNSENPLSQYKFYQLEMKYYDNNGFETVVPATENSKAYADLKHLDVVAPTVEGTYVYHFRFSYYNKGEVSYGLKVVVSSEPNYEIIDLMKYKNTSLKDVASIEEVLNLLPYAKYKDGMIIRTNSKPAELQIDYKTLAVKKEELLNNTIALFTLIPELDFISYHTENEVSVYTRNEIENQVGRNLSDYSNNMELWKSEILFKEKVLDEVVKRDEICKAILSDVCSERNSGDDTILIIDTESFANNKLLELSSVDRQEILEYASTFAPIVYDMSRKEYEGIHSRELMIGLLSVRNSIKIVDISSGDEIKSFESQTGKEVNESFVEKIEEGKYIYEVFVFENGIKQLLEYEVYFAEDKWNVTKL